MDFLDRAKKAVDVLFGSDVEDASGESARMTKRLAVVLSDIADDQSKNVSSDPILRMVKRLPGRGVEHRGKMYLYYVLREMIPVVNAAIMKRRFLEGRLVIDSDDEGLRRSLREWWRTVPVGYLADRRLQRGGDVWLDNLAENTDTYGTAPGEIVFGDDGRYVDRLVAPNPRTFYFKKVTDTDEGSIDKDLYRLYQRQDGREVEINGEWVRLLYFSHNAESPWGRPLVWGQDFVSEIILRMLVSLNNLWWRSGDPSTFWNIVYDKEARVSTAEMDEDLDDLESIVQGVFKARRQGKVADAFFGTKGGKVEKSAIGENIIIQSLAPYLRDHYTTLVGQVVGVADIPTWMYPAGLLPTEGIGSERPKMESSMATQAASLRNDKKLPIARLAIEAFLVSEGSSRFADRYSLSFDMANVIDEKAEAETRKIESEADDQTIANALILSDVGAIEDLVDYLRERGVLSG